MKTKVTIIGAGAVGATTAYSILACGAAQEIVLIDINTEKAYGEAMDIVQATPFLQNAKVYAGDYKDAAGSDVVIITSGLGRKPGQTRLELAQVNVGIIKSISKEITKYCPEATYIIVANPVDVLTYAFLKYTGLPKHKVFGTGTALDTIRLRTRLSEIYHVNPSQVHANVLGEHGDSSFIAWSSASISGVPLDQYSNALVDKNGLDFSFDKEDVVKYVKTSGGEIIKRKGCTVYGIATSTMHILKSMRGENPSVFTVSTMLDGEYGIEGVCLSTLALVGSNGIQSIIAQNLNEEEQAKLQKSAEALKAVIDSIEF